jgi:hypothetical protein
MAAACPEVSSSSSKNFRARSRRLRFSRDAKSLEWSSRELGTGIATVAGMAEIWQKFWMKQARKLRRM